MAGTGDHQVMKAIAEKRKEFKDFRQPLRLGLYSHAVMINQALGILFMGGGQYSLRHDRQAIAMLLLATYPFGNAAHPAEERHYLAANRHLYAIAVEKRSLQAFETQTGKLVRLPICVYTKDVVNGKHVTSRYRTVLPTLMPPRDKVLALRVESQSHLPLFFFSEEQDAQCSYAFGTQQGWHTIATSRQHSACRYYRGIGVLQAILLAGYMNVQRRNPEVAPGRVLWHIQDDESVMDRLWALQMSGTWGAGGLTQNLPRSSHFDILSGQYVTLLQTGDVLRRLSLQNARGLRALELFYKTAYSGTSSIGVDNCQDGWRILGNNPLFFPLEICHLASDLQKMISAPGPLRCAIRDMYASLTIHNLTSLTESVRNDVIIALHILKGPAMEEWAYFCREYMCDQCGNALETSRKFRDRSSYVSDDAKSDETLGCRSIFRRAALDSRILDSFEQHMVVVEPLVRMHFPTCAASDILSEALVRWFIMAMKGSLYLCTS
eukprot:GHVT01043971.1.p1 GENE.GHVT01043971.1~~GHVT01043971.1.p1  ORF type:complete len:493 (+),score=2.97 GHVT01043971.1:797-2275(+)